MMNHFLAVRHNSGGNAFQSKRTFFSLKRYYLRGLPALMLLISVFANSAAGQGISLEKGWKFSAGDSSLWASPTFNDSSWKPINVTQPWEQQGYPKYDGFGWYRLHVVIPLSLKNKAYLKDSVRFHLGIIDDNDQVFLNGILIGEYGGDGGDIKTSKFGPRTYTIGANNPAIRWGAENVLAIRVYDTGGDGGVYGDKHSIAMASLLDDVDINTGADFTFGDHNTLSKPIQLITESGYAYTGTLKFKAIDPETGRTAFEKSENVAFSAGKPFSDTFVLSGLRKRSYKVIYTFTEAKSHESCSKTEGTPYILTPPVSAKPQINGPDVFGARPGNPFLYRIPATGRMPMHFAVANLPTGLSVDPGTGIITGTVAQPGDYQVVLSVHNALGTVTKNFTIKIGNLIGLTPALGWNSWNAFGLTVNDNRVRVAAKTMSDKLAAHGWTYINIDDGWEAPQRQPDGTIIPNQKFPDMPSLTGYVHSLGLKMGIYSSPGPRTCGGYLGSWQHEDQDAQTYGNWGIDYLKYDWCSYSEVTDANPTLADYKKPYQVMRAALDKVHRDILFSFCQYGMGDVWKWGAEVGGNSWRTTGDITDTWQSMSTIGFNQVADGLYAQPGHFNDPDMLVVGKVGWGSSQHYTRLTPDEQYTHISLWSLLSAPLLIGCDMGKMDPFTMNLLTNDEVLAIDQDALGKEARRAVKTDGYQIWIKDLENGDKAVGVFNTSEKYKTITLNMRDNAFRQYFKVTDVWRQIYLTTHDRYLTFKVAPHGVMLLRMSGRR